jgi:low affinity Fe/Cu permease
MARGLLIPPRMEKTERSLARKSLSGHAVGAAERLARGVARFAASTTAFLLAVSTVVVWALLGPFFRYSDTWQLVINTGTTIITFLMVFLIQRTQDKDNLAIQLKLNELLAALEGASNRLVNVESLSEADLEVLHRHFAHLAEMAATARDLRESHSIDEAASRHETKHGQQQSGRPS